MKVEIEGGKYTYVFSPDGWSKVLRHGENWKDVTGDKFLYCMAAEIESLREQLAELERQNAELRKVAIAMRNWIDAVPKNTVLPTMPGFDRDWADAAIASAKEKS